MSKKRKNKKLKKIQMIISAIVLVCIAILSYINQDVLSNDANAQNVGQISNTKNLEENVSTTKMQSSGKNENTTDMKNVGKIGNTTESVNQNSKTNFDLSTIPSYTSRPYVEINNNTPYFTEEDYTTEPFEKYSDLDSKNGRCGVAYANVCKEIMPVDGEKRESISSVKPTGWVNVKYDGEYLYNRCHLIGYQLSAENANEKNLITGTRYFNVEGMLPFENKVAEYIDKKSNNHVLYRVTPIFEGDNLVASGVEMEAYSVEDNGKGVQFNVFVYNVQPGIKIDYATGKSTKNKN